VPLRERRKLRLAIVAQLRENVVRIEAALSEAQKLLENEERDLRLEFGAAGLDASPLTADIQ
jgi:hypothetical protein